MARVPKVRLDELLVTRGLATDLREATGLIMAGKVVIASAVSSKAGQPVREDAEIHIRGHRSKFVSRGGEKLEAGLSAFGVDVDGRVVLDAGASTGGFTDCCLQRGARLVYAVDVGFGQLRGKLAVDPRVVNIERTNIEDVPLERLDPPIDLAVADLSNLTLTKAVPILTALFVKPPELVVLVKPLFEGLAREDMERAEGLSAILRELLSTLQTLGLGVHGVIASPIRGGRASVEFLAHLRSTAGPDLDELCRTAVDQIPPR